MIERQSELSGRILQSLRNGRDSILIRDGQLEWTGGQIIERIDALKQTLAEASPPGGRIGIGFPNGATQGLAILATLVSERVPVIVSSSDLLNDPIAWIRRADACLFASDEMSEPAFAEKAETMARVTISPEGWPRIRKAPLCLPPPPARDPSGEGLVLFTSGSTGEPKGIRVPEAGILRTADYLIEYFDLNPTTVSPVLLPICHSMALHTQFLPTLLAGGQSCFVNARVNLNRLYREILSCRGTLISLIGETLRICWEERERKALPPADFVTHVQLAGGFITPRHLWMARQLFPNAILHKGYGLTEAIRVSMISSLEPGFDSASVGRPLPFVEVEIRRPEGVIMEPEIIGEIHVRGPNVMLGTLSGGHSRLEPRNDDGFLATGDFGLWNRHGQLCISGRRDSLFKVNGHRVSGLEIERIALESSPRVRNAKCVAVENGIRGGYRVVLYLEAEMGRVQDESGGEQGLDSAWLRDLHGEISRRFRSLAHFPKEILLLPRFPKTSNGKIAVKKLIESSLDSPRILLFQEPRSKIQLFGIHPDATHERISL